MTGSIQSFWSRQFRVWHWMSSAIVLALMLLFSVTGLTLNNPGWFSDDPVIEERETKLSGDIQEKLGDVSTAQQLDDELIARLSQETSLPLTRAKTVQVEYGEVIFDLSGPGVRATLTIDTAAGDAFYERADLGVVARLNDLHKGRDAGLVWGLLIDFTAVVCIIFCLSGLGLLVINSQARKLTWPITTLGIAGPLVAYILFVHS